MRIAEMAIGREFMYAGVRYRVHCHSMSFTSCVNMNTYLETTFPKWAMADKEA